MRYIVEALDTLTIHRKEMFCEATCRGSFIGHVLSAILETTVIQAHMHFFNRKPKKYQPSQLRTATKDIRGGKLMNGLKKRLVSGVLLLAFMLSFIVQASAGQIDANIDETISTPTVVVDSNDNKYVMHGASGTTLLVKPVSTAEYEELTSILYPNGIFNEQGQSMDAIADADVVRAEYIANHTKAYAYNGSTQTEVPLTPFTLRLEDRSNGAFDALMYRCSIGSDTFIFPSEWGRHEFGFAYAQSTQNPAQIHSPKLWHLQGSFSQGRQPARWP